MQKAIYLPEEEREAAYDALIVGEYKTFIDHLERRLSANEKYYGGDQVSRHDIQIGAFFYGWFLSNGPEKRVFNAQNWLDATPERVTKFLKDFGETFKTYLDARPDSSK